MIISASRRTDLPAAHADWLVNRFREGFVLVRNPMNPRQVSRISLRPEDVDGIVFWTKNPAPLMEHLSVFEPYPYYFQYTLTGYDRDAEANLPPHTERIDTFLRLSEKLGAERVLWRYDPILINDRYSPGRHIDAFRRLAERLRGATERVTISFVDVYPRNRRRLEALQAASLTEDMMCSIARNIAQIARENGLQTVSCAEAIDLSECGISHAACVDARLLGRIGGIPLNVSKDANQRPACGCAPSADIGAYNTCPHGCLYCYANYSPAFLKANLQKQDDLSPLLCDHLSEEDRITERKPVSLRNSQIRMEL